MVTFAEFEAEVQNALLYLNDPTHLPGPALGQVLHAERASDLRKLLLAAIESLKPDAAVPPTARAHRLYELLHSRFVEELPQQECSRRLGLSLRHLRREQQSAIHLLAEQLWPKELDHYAGVTEVGDAPTPTWRAQLHQELSALHQHTPTGVSEVAKVIKDAVTLFNDLGVHPQVQVIVEGVQSGATASIHPSVLSQLIFVVIDKLASSGATHILVRGSNLRAWSRIAIQYRPASPETLSASDFVTEILAVHGAQASISYASGRASIDLLFPADKKYVVLVVDDNLDLVHFYKRYVEGTGYEIAHVSQGREVWQAVESRSPNALVLDVMLPDMNGWHLLRELRKHPSTANIPIIICSVINQEELAKTLGAAAYLAKPVHRQNFLQILDQVRLNG